MKKYLLLVVLLLTVISPASARLKAIGFGGGGLPLSAFGDLRTIELTPVMQGSFEYTVDNTELNMNTEVNGGTVTQASAMAVVGTSTTTASTALFQSKRHAKYRAGLGSLMRFTASFTSPVAGTTQCAGIIDEVGSGATFKNGLAVCYDGLTFNFNRYANDAVTSKAISAWDDPLDGSGPSGMEIDQTKINVWSINFQYLGAGAIILSVEDDSTGFFVPVHTIQYANKNTVPSSFNPNYHYTLWVDNGGTTSDVIVRSASYGYFIEGKTEFSELQQPQFSTDFQSKGGVTTEVAILTIRNKATYASKTNFIDIVLEHLSASIEASSANNLGEIHLVRNATLGGTPSYSDINTTNSVIEIDTSGTTVTGGVELLHFPLAGKNDKVGEILIPYKGILGPGETLTISGESANSATIKAALLWKELF